MKHFFVLLSFIISYPAVAQQNITPQEAANHIGDSVSVCGKVFGGMYLQRDKQQLYVLTVGAAYPDNPFTAIISNQAKTSLSKAPAAYYINSVVCFTGRMVAYNNKPQMVIYSVNQISGVVTDKINNEPEK